MTEYSSGLDWRNITEYPSCANDLEDWQWKWEFMRRTTEYRDHYENASTMQHPDYRTPTIRDFEGPKGFALKRKFGLGALPRPNLSATELNDELNGDPYRTWWPRRIVGLPKSGWIGLMRMFDDPKGPLVSELTEGKRRDVDFSEDSVHSVLDFMEQVYCMPEVTDEGKTDYRKIVTLMFDMNRPIKPQIEEAERLLTDIARHNRLNLRAWRDERKYWPRYLRVIDAEDGSIKPAEIFLEISASEMSTNAYDKLVTKTKNPSQMGKNWISSARNIMNKVSFYS